jgi:exodeoxyribonuclease-3
MKQIRILSWNVNGIRAVQKKGFVEWFTSEEPEILCIQETKAWKEQLTDELTDPAGYSVYFAEAERKGYSGVALYTKLEPVRVEYSFGERSFDPEGRTIVADYEDFILFNVYFPNGKASKERLKYKMDFYDAFLYQISGLLKKNRRIVVCGDVNTAHREIDLARPKENEKISGFLPEERAWIQYTWWDMKTRARERNIGWRIDYFFASENLKDSVNSSFILSDVQGSDHCPIGIALSL